MSSLLEPFLARVPVRGGEQNQDTLALPSFLSGRTRPEPESLAKETIRRMEAEEWKMVEPVGIEPTT